MRKLSWQGHATTICDYLNTYVCIDKGPERDEISGRFFKYLFLACHRKMRQRMSHWIDRGQLYEFHRVMLLMSQDNYTDTYSPSAPDSQLAKSLCALEASPGVCEMFSVIAQASLLWASKDNDLPSLGFDFSNSFRAVFALFAGFYYWVF